MDMVTIFPKHLIPYKKKTSKEDEGLKEKITCHIINYSFMTATTVYVTVYGTAVIQPL